MEYIILCWLDKGWFSMFQCTIKRVCVCVSFSLGLTVATLLFGFTRSLFMFNTLVCSAQMLHSRMFNCILRAPVHFFDINPIGESAISFSYPF